MKPSWLVWHPQPYIPATGEGGRSMRVRVSKRWRIVLLLLSAVLALLGVLSFKYIWLYVSRKADPRPLAADVLRDPEAAKNPELLLIEANPLGWLFNSPKSELLHIRAEARFKERVDLQNEICPRVGTLRRRH